MHARVDDRARGTPIVLVHGLGVSSRYLVPPAKALAPDHPVYLPDLPGFGLSAKPDRMLDIEELAGALLAWMDANGLEKPVMLANSMGCQVIAALAARRPDRVERLILVGPTVDPAWRTLWRQIPRWLIELVREPLAILPVLIVDYLRCGIRRFFATGRHALAHKLEEDLAKIDVPTLVVRGRRDAFVSLRWARQLAACHANAQLGLLPGPHAAHFQMPRALAAMVRRFVQGRPLGAGVTDTGPLPARRTDDGLLRPASS